MIQEFFLHHHGLQRWLLKHGLLLLPAQFPRARLLRAADPVLSPYILGSFEDADLGDPVLWARAAEFEAFEAEQAAAGEELDTLPATERFMTFLEERFGYFAIYDAFDLFDGTGRPPDSLREAIARQKEVDDGAHAR